MKETLKDRRSHGFYLIDNAVLTAIQPLRGSARVYALSVYNVLAFHARERQSFPGMARIANLLDCSKPTVVKAIGNLEKIGLIHVQRGKTAKGENATNVYTLLPVQTEGGSKGDLLGGKPSLLGGSKGGLPEQDSDQQDSKKKTPCETSDDVSPQELPSPLDITSEQLDTMPIPQVKLWFEDWLKELQDMEPEAYSALIQVGASAVIEAESQGKNRKGIPQVINAALKARFIQIARARLGWQDMLEAVANALGVGLTDPNMPGRVGQLINDSLWSGPNAYSPDEIQDFIKVKEQSAPGTNWRQFITFNTLPEKLSRYRNWRKDNPNAERWNTNGRQPTVTRSTYSRGGDQFREEEERQQRQWEAAAKDFDPDSIPDGM